MTLRMLLAFVTVILISSLAFGTSVRRAHEKGGPRCVKLLLIEGTIGAAVVLLPYYLFVYSGHMSPWRYWVGPWLIAVGVGLLPLASTIGAGTLALLPGSGSPTTPSLVVAPSILLAVLAVVLGFCGSIFVGGAYWFTVPVEVAIACLWGLTVFVMGLRRTRGGRSGAPTVAV